MFIVDDLARSAVKLASDVVETATGGLLDPARMVQDLLESSLADLVTLVVFTATGNPLALTPLAQDLAEILKR